MASLPANISLTLPSDVDSEGLELPTFGEEEGIEALSFFLGDLVKVPGNATLQEFQDLLVAHVEVLSRASGVTYSSTLSRAAGEDYAPLKPHHAFPDDASPSYENGGSAVTRRAAGARAP